MDLGLENKKAIVCTVNTDLGLACARALAGEGVCVFATCADTDALEQVLDSFSDSQPGAVEGVSCDIATPAGREQILSCCPEPDILINHAPGPPMGDFRQWGRPDWEKALNANLLSAVEMIRLTIDGMVTRGFGRIINITSQSVRAPMANLDLSNAARAGLTGFSAGVARTERDADVTINNLLPGMFVTDPLRKYISKTAAAQGLDEVEATRRLLAGNPLGRLGEPEEFGATCAFLCSKQAAYINGQNILLDGGTFPGVT